MRITKTCDYILVLLVAIMMLAASGCRSHREGTSGNDYESTATGSKDLRKRLDNAMTLADASSHWDRLKVPVKLGGLGITLSGNAYFERNKQIYISLRFLGAEVAFASVTNDSIIIVDKFHSRYVAEPLSIVKDALGLNVSNIQDLLLGVAFAIGKDTPKVSDFDRNTLKSSTLNAGEWSVARHLNKGIDCVLDFSPADQLAMVSAPTAPDKQVEARYSDLWPLTDTKGGVLAGRIDLSIPRSSGVMTANLRYTFKKAEWNRSVNIPAVRIPATAQRVSVESLIGILQKL